MTLLILQWLLGLAPAAAQLRFPVDYYKEFPPLPSANPDRRLIVKISIQFINVLKINEVDGEMQFSCFYRVYWNDTRVPRALPAQAMTVLSARTRRRLWRPDIITENVRGAERNGIIKPTIFNAQMGSGQMFYSTYLAIRVGCPFVYSSYPIDVQACRIHIGTMGLTTTEVELQWHALAYLMDRYHFLKFHDLFRLKVCEDMRHQLRHSVFGEHPQKTLILVFERNFKYSVFQVYLPSVLFILIAWLSVLVPPTMLRTRLLLNSTNLLTLISMFLSIARTESARVPKVSYITALNLWMFVCVAFCFSSVLLVILDIRLVVILTNPGRPLETFLDFFRAKSTSSSVTLLFEEEADEDDDAFVDASDVTPEDSTVKMSESELRARVAEKRIEWLSRTAGFEHCYLVSYPLLFLLFTAGYFSFFLWKRRAQMTELLLESGGKGARYPGCWCAPDDAQPGCIPETEYANL